MTIKIPWRAEYWPKIIEEQKLKVENEKDNGTWPYFYDSNGVLRKLLGEKMNPIHRHHNYIYVSDGRIIAQIISSWENFQEYSLRDFIRRMKTYEKMHMHKAIYNKRKEEFDALDSKTNS